MREEKRKQTALSLEGDREEGSVLGLIGEGELLMVPSNCATKQILYFIYQSTHVSWHLQLGGVSGPPVRLQTLPPQPLPVKLSQVQTTNLTKGRGVTFLSLQFFLRFSLSLKNEREQSRHHFRNVSWRKKQESRICLYFTSPLNVSNQTSLNV